MASSVVVALGGSRKDVGRRWRDASIGSLGRKVDIASASRLREKASASRLREKSSSQTSFTPLREEGDRGRRPTREVGYY